ncbi:MAG: sirohydrochlorin chelatase [Nitrospirota bacterium]
MLHYTQRRFKAKRAVRRTLKLKHNQADSVSLEEAQQGAPCRGESLVSSVDGTVTKCGCGRYHVRINAVTLHLTALQFDAAARLFKLAWGMVVGRRISVSMSRLTCVPLLALLAVAWWTGLALASTPGFLVVAPDRGFVGNQETSAVFEAFNASYPAALAYGGRDYSDRPGNYSSYLTSAIDRLKADGATEIVAIPLFLSSADPVLKTVQSTLASRAGQVPVRWTPPMQDSYLTAQILLDRVAALSRDPEAERVILLGAGAADAGVEEKLRADLDRLAAYVATYRRFKEISTAVYYDREAEATLRDAKNDAVDELITTAAAKKGRTLVVPWMIGPKFDQGMSQIRWLKDKFADLDVVLDEQEVLTHPNALLWLKKTANQYVPASRDQIGVVIMPHGSTQPYNDVVEATIAPLRSRYRIEMAYGMADSFTIQQAVSRLEAQGVRRIAFIRLYALADHMKPASDYILGLSDAPSDAGHAHGDHGAPPAQVRSAALFSTYGGYEEDHRAIAEILHERIQSVSTDPAKETVILVAHGSGGDDANAAWLQTMNDHVTHLKKLTKKPFRAIKVATVREDWPEKRAKAVADLKEVIAEGNRGGRVLVIANRLYGGGPYARLLDGATYVMNDQGFAPHPNLTRWLETGIERTITALSAGTSEPMAGTDDGDKFSRKD